jgi:hypothetical protein
MKRYFRLGFAGVVTSTAAVLGFACSSEEISEPIGEVSQGLRVEDRIVRKGPMAGQGLYFCDADSDCTSGQICCAGYCAAASSTTGRLADIVGGRLQYRCFSMIGYAARSILPDYSFAGYKGGGVRLPTKGTLNTDYKNFTSPPLMPTGTCSDGENIQAQLVAARAAAASSTVPIVVRLAPGIFHICQPLFMTDSRVVLQGTGQSTNETVLRSYISSVHTLITVAPSTTPDLVADGNLVKVSSTVRLGATRIPLASVPSSWKKGDTILVWRTSNDAWLTEVGEPDDDWTPFKQPAAGSVPRSFKPAQVQLRKIAADPVGNTITVDIPLVDWIIENPGSSYYGGGQVQEIQPPTYVQTSGVESLRIESQFVDTLPDYGNPDIPDDDIPDDGMWNAIGLRRAKDCWVRNVTVTTYSGSAVTIGDESIFNTVESVAHLDPESPPRPPGSSNQTPENGHRYSFNVSSGSVGNLFQRCFTRSSRHSFVSGVRTAGPNVWLDCMALNQHADAGPHKEWNTGGLFDNIHAELSPEALSAWPDGAGLAAVFDENNHGWRGAQMMFWNADALVNSESAPTSRNFVVGGVARMIDNISTPLTSIWQLNETVVKPRSLYLQQLEDRLGSAAVDNVVLPQQRTGRIFDALRAWAGENELKDNDFPDPECLTGDRATSPGPTCCHGSCNAKCGAGNCGEGGTASLCCVQTIKASGRSCAHYPPPCVMPDPECSFSDMENGKYCCSANCVACAAENCGNSPPDATCCSGAMQALKRSCKEYPPPCIEESDPTCAFGVPGPGVCCDPSCNQCGGPGCGHAPNTADKCCVTDIIAAGKSCSTEEAPCVLPP